MGASSHHGYRMPDLDDGFRAIGAAFVVLAVFSTSTEPCVAALLHPAFADRAAACRSGWGRLDFALPIRSLLFHPGIEAEVAIFIVAKDHL